MGTTTGGLALTTIDGEVGGAGAFADDHDANLQAIVDELDTKAEGSHVHAASAVTVTPAGNVAATDVQAAIVELDTEKAGTGHTHSVTATQVEVTPAGTVAATNVQAALVELDTEKSAVGHAHGAADITTVPAGNLVATNVQAAIDELDGEKANNADLDAKLDAGHENSDVATTHGSGIATDGYVLTADGLGGAAWEATELVPPAGAKAGWWVTFTAASTPRPGGADSSYRVIWVGDYTNLGAPTERLSGDPILDTGATV